MVLIPISEHTCHPPKAFLPAVRHCCNLFADCIFHVAYSVGGGPVAAEAGKLAVDGFIQRLDQPVSRECHEAKDIQVLNIVQTVR